MKPMNHYLVEKTPLASILCQTNPFNVLISYLISILVIYSHLRFRFQEGKSYRIQISSGSLPNGWLELFLLRQSDRSVKPITHLHPLSRLRTFGASCRIGQHRSCRHVCMCNGITRVPFRVQSFLNTNRPIGEDGPSQSVTYPISGHVQCCVLNLVVFKSV